MKDKSLIYIHSFIAVISCLLYARLGMFFIVLMTPYIVYLVFLKDARLTPALIAHCASATSAATIIFLAIILCCFKNRNILKREKWIGYIFIILSILLPLFLLLVIQKFMLDGLDIKNALVYGGFYMSFWSFLYGYIVSSSWDNTAMRNAYFVLAALSLLSLVSGLHLRTIIIYKVIFCSLSVVLAFKKRFLLAIPCFLYGLYIGLFSEKTSFTQIFNLLTPFLLVLFIWQRKNKRLVWLTGWRIYLIWIALMAYGISNYQTVDTSSSPDEISFNSWNSFWGRFQYKLFDDRAIFWDAALTQILVYHPLLPMHDIPNIAVQKYASVGEQEVEFGGHNTVLELIRRFGIIMGLLLVCCFIIIGNLSTKYFLHQKKIDFHLALFAMAASSITICFLTGTYAMLIEYSLSGFGLLGVAFGLFVNKPNGTVLH